MQQDLDNLSKNDINKLKKIYDAENEAYVKWYNNYDESKSTALQKAYDAAGDAEIEASKFLREKYSEKLWFLNDPEHLDISSGADTFISTMLYDHVQKIYDQEHKKK